MCRKHATYRWKALDKGYNFASNYIAIRGLNKKLCTLKVIGVPAEEFRDSHLGVPGQKAIWMWPLWRGAKYTIRGEGGDFPQVRVVVNLVCPSCLWFILAPKVLQLCTNQFVLVLCKSVWVIEGCHFFLAPSQSSNMALYPSIVLWARESAPTPCSFVIFSLGLTFESLKELRAR